MPSNSNLVSFSFFLGSAGILRVGSCKGNSMAFAKVYPVILHGNHPITELLIKTEHLRLLHAGLTLLVVSIVHRFHVVQLCKTVR